ncbi:hypothetical protein [Oceanisphaera arctica]|uniref:PEGA domain-containing protein n=1 Tax=Oceanisphaera arctica TaxID=641510 RepID=A0A2P5TIT3_9GAMM|nr:hypothetical protein [Oceanisphaera arctica]PPL14753.1 hypothetical protein UN63_14830 [Oceanisphaera arctica]
MKIKYLLTLALVTSLTTGCASIFNGSTQVVNIRSNDADARLYVNEQYMGKESAIYTFKKKENYVIRAEKDGCKSNIVTPEKSFDPTTLLGILIDWGLISILVVDGAATGAWQEFTSTSYVIDPECTA